MTLKELVDCNNECGTLYIRESDGNFSRPIFTRRFPNNMVIPDDILDREVKHIQPGVERENGDIHGCLLITLFI